jgi:restriction system protein
MIHSPRPRFFEWLIVAPLVAMGYGGSPKDTGEASAQRGNRSVNGIISEEKLGLDAT